MIQAITFDLDGVYFPRGKHEFMYALEKYGVLPSEAERVFLDSDEMHQYKLGKLTDTEFWGWAIGQWRLRATVEEIIALLIDSYDVDRSVVTSVRRAREQGYKALVCSNNFPARVNGLQKRFQFMEEFDVIVLSYDVGATKPGAKIFQEMVARAGVPATSIAYADDKATNVDAAKKLGITAFTYENFDQFTTQLKQIGVEL